MASRICGVEVMPRHSALRIGNPPQPCPPGGPTCSADRISHAASFHAAGICRQPKQMYPVMHRHAQRELRSSACEHCSFSRPRPRNEKARKHNHKSNGVHSSAPGSHHQGGKCGCRRRSGCAPWVSSPIRRERRFRRHYLALRQPPLWRIYVEMLGIVRRHSV